jgi:hypothetical protein
MQASSVFMGLLAVPAIFAPQEVMAYASGQSAVFGSLAFQVFGAVYFGFALLNWMAQANLIGGIYSRPVAMGNFVHFLVAALALLKAVLAGHHSMQALAVAAAYTAFALLFAVVLFGNPLPTAAGKNEA